MINCWALLIYNKNVIFIPGWCYYKQGNYDSALSILGSLDGDVEDNLKADVLYLNALCYYKQVLKTHQ